MLEVVFSDSAKGALKVAKNYNKENMLSGANGYIGKKPSKKELEKQFEGKAVGGNSKDVVCIGFNLDIVLPAELTVKNAKMNYQSVWV